MLFASEAWRVACQTPAERDALLAYAESQGVPVWRPTYCDPKALTIGWLDLFGELLAYEQTGPEATVLLPAADFRARCRAYSPLSVLA